MRKKILVAALIAAMALSLAACGGSSDNGSSNDAQGAAEAVETAAAVADAASDAADAQYVVGICQLVQHDALDAATTGFRDALTDALGDAVTFDEQNAQGDSNTCSTIVGQARATITASILRESALRIF